VRIAVFSLCYNERLILPYFMRHYWQFADQITILDNHSTDGSADLARELGGLVVPYESGNQVRDDIYQRLKNNCWKGCEADWVIVVDADEFVHCPDMAVFLARQQEAGATLLRPHGWDMVHDRLPTTAGQIYDEVRRGSPSTFYDKPCVFRPGEIAEINFVPGAHNARPTGRVVEARDASLRLLHFRGLSADYLVARYRERAGRLSQRNLQRGWGRHYQKPEAAIRRQHARELATAQEVQLGMQARSDL
jgi:hypothetical protein